MEGRREALFELPEAEEEWVEEEEEGREECFGGGGVRPEGVTGLSRMG
jgi:hypothetical protein